MKVYYEIYQMVQSEKTQGRIFWGLEHQEGGVRWKDYRLVYRGDEKGKNFREILEKLFQRFKITQSGDYWARPLSVSDIVKLNSKAYFYDTLGWLEIYPLPACCFARHPDSGRVIFLVRNKKGYSVCPDKCQREGADKLNKSIGVTPAQVQAMLVGSMFGWNVPGAYPDHYDSDGKPKEFQ